MTTDHSKLKSKSHMIDPIRERSIDRIKLPGLSVKNGSKALPMVAREPTNESALFGAVNVLLQSIWPPSTNYAMPSKKFIFRSPRS
jgi:hypothetical protein